MGRDLRRRVADAMLAVDVANGGKADMYMLADAAIQIALETAAQIIEEAGSEMADAFFSPGPGNSVWAYKPRDVAEEIRSLLPPRSEERT